MKNEILQQFKQTVLGRGYVIEGYTDKEILERFTMKQMKEKIQNMEKDMLKSRQLDNMINNHKQKHKTFGLSLE